MTTVHLTSSGRPCQICGEGVVILATYRILPEGSYGYRWESVELASTKIEREPGIVPKPGIVPGRNPSAEGRVNATVRDEARFHVTVPFRGAVDGEIDYGVFCARCIRAACDTVEPNDGTHGLDVLKLMIQRQKD